MKIVNLCITNSEKNKILLINRNKPPYVNYWGMLGGKVEKDEGHKEASMRELFEESGIKCDGEFLGKCHEKIFEKNKLIYEFDIYFYHFVVDEDVEIVSDGREGKIKWFDMDKFGEELVIPSDPLMTNNFLNKEFKRVISFVEKIEGKYIQDKFFKDYKDE